MGEEYIPRSVVVDLLTEKQRAICPVGRLGRGYVYGRDRDEYDAIEADIDTVQNIPAADVRPVVRGRWREVPAGAQYGCCVRYFECSACNRTQSYGEPDFCPWCGADMREDAL